YARGLVGFLVGALVIFLTQMIVPGMRVTVIGALLASLVIGIVDLFVPTTMRGADVSGQRSKD
nr:phage holin family protein [Bacilli bacterium]